MFVSWTKGGLGLDTIDRVLLNAVQTRFPVEPRPYSALADLAGISENEAFARIQTFRRNGVIRRIGGVFNSHRLGYVSTLCAAKVPEDKVAVLTDLLATIHGVTHNYLRDHLYNMWFTLIVTSQPELEKILNSVRETSGVFEIYSLPAIRLFKIKVEFDLESISDSTDENELETTTQFEYNINPDFNLTQETQSYPLQEDDIALIRLLQGNLAESLTPYASLAESLNCTEDKVIFDTKRLINEKVIRRFGAVLRHQKAGFTANAMGVWEVPPEQVNQVGEKMALFREVSHCYQRPTLIDWPYNLFTMVHGRTHAECERVMESISQATGIVSYKMLFSVAELKKSSMQYFPEEEDSDL